MRVSAADQDSEKNKSDILRYANDKDLGKAEFVEEKVSETVSWKKRKIEEVAEQLGDGDNTIVSELLRIGRSMPEVMRVFSGCRI